FRGPFISTSQPVQEALIFGAEPVIALKFEAESVQEITGGVQVAMRRTSFDDLDRVRLLNSPAQRSVSAEFQIANGTKMFRSATTSWSPLNRTSERVPGPEDKR